MNEDVMERHDGEKKHTAGDVLLSFIVAITTYSRIPLPYIRLDKNRPRFLFCFFPVVGVLIAAVQFIWIKLAHYSGVYDSMIACAICVAIPLLVTGGIHVDGYMDCVDAFSSYRDKDERLRILKDPHIGAFAVMYTIIYALLYFCALRDIMLRADMGALLLIMGMYVYERILIGIFLLRSSMARQDGMLSMYMKDVSVATTAVALSVWIVTYVSYLAFVVYHTGVEWYMAVIPSVAAVAVGKYNTVRSHRLLDGMTGDTCGYILQLMELTGIVAIALVIRIV